MQSPDNPLTVSHSAFTQEGKEHHLGWRGPGAPADCGTALSRGRVTVCPLLRQHLPDWPGSVAGTGVSFQCAYGQWHLGQRWPGTERQQKASQMPPGGFPPQGGAGCDRAGCRPDGTVDRVSLRDESQVSPPRQPLPTGLGCKSQLTGWYLRASTHCLLALPVLFFLFPHRGL